MENKHYDGHRQSSRTSYINTGPSLMVGLVSRSLTSTKRHIVDSNSIRTIVCQLYNVENDESARGIRADNKWRYAAGDTKEKERA